MRRNDWVPFIRILNANEHHGDELWVIAAVARLLNVIRVWILEVETITRLIQEKGVTTEENLAYLHDSAEDLSKILRHSYVVLRSDDYKTELAFLEDELFKFETRYLNNSMTLTVTEERVEFQMERYEFLRHSLHGVLHDLNQPASAMASFVSLSSDGLMDGDLDFLKNMKELVVQTKAQLERGFELIKGSFAVEELSVQNIKVISEETLKTLLKGDNIEYKIDEKIVQGTVMYSSMWLRGLMSNIVDNARKSFWIKGEHEGHGDFPRHIYISLEKGEASTTRAALLIKISDSGVGFDREILEHGFAEGQSMWEDKKLLGQGVGMAAHVEYIKKLGGDVVLHNLDENGHIEGAELVVKLPLVT